MSPSVETDREKKSTVPDANSAEVLYTDMEDVCTGIRVWDLKISQLQGKI